MRQGGQPGQQGRQIRRLCQIQRLRNPDQPPRSASPVSYTHLDVYKRQVLQVALRPPAAFRSLFRIAQRDNELCAGEERTHEGYLLFQWHLWPQKANFPKTTIVDFFRYSQYSGREGLCLSLIHI